MIKKRKFNFYKRILVAFILINILLLAACQEAVPGITAEDKVKVTVSILPQAYFVERIGADAVTINVMVGPGEEPHTYEPKPEQMKGLSRSELFFMIGTEYEDAWLPRFKDVNPNLVFVDNAAGIERIPLTAPHHHGDEPTDEALHTDEDLLDPHVWLSPNNGKIIANNILNALIEQEPGRAEEFQANYNYLIADINDLDNQIITILQDLDQRTFLVFHPAWGYFAEQYGLIQVPVEVGGQEPSPTDMVNLVNIAREEQIRVIFVQPSFSTANAIAIAKEIGAEVAVVDPLARDWLQNLKVVAEAFAEAANQ